MLPIHCSMQYCLLSLFILFYIMKKLLIFFYAFYRVQVKTIKSAITKIKDLSSNDCVSSEIGETLKYKPFKLCKFSLKLSLEYALH